MSNQIILTVVNNDDVLRASGVATAVPFKITVPGGEEQLALSPDGTVDRISRFPIAAFQPPDLIPKPHITFPADGDIVSPIMTLTTSPWSHVYRRAMARMLIEVATDTEFSTIVFSKEITDGSEDYRFLLHELPGETVLFIRVYKEESAPYDQSSAVGAWSDTITVTTLESPYIIKPVVTITNRHDGITDNPPQFASSPFSFVGVFEQTHVSTVWKLTDIVTGDIVEKTSLTDLLSITWDPLEYNQKCTISCKYTGDTLYDSEWADPVLFVLEDAPRTLEPEVTYPVHGDLGIAPYVVVTTAPMVTNRPGADPVAARYAIYVASTLIADIVLRLDTYMDPITWEDASTITETRTVTSVAKLYELDYGALPYMYLSSNLTIHAWHVDSILGPSADAAGIEQPAISTATISPTIYTGAIVSPINGATDIQLSPTITNNITPITWTLPLITTYKDTLNLTLTVSDITGGIDTVYWTKNNATASDLVTKALQIKSKYRVDFLIRSTNQPTWTDTKTSDFFTIEELIPVMVVNGSAIKSPTNGSASPLYPGQFRAPSVSLFNIDDLTNVIVTVSWELYNYSTGALISTYSTTANTTNQSASTWYTWYTGTSLAQNTTYTLRVRYTTNYPTQLPPQGWITSVFYVPQIKLNAPSVSSNGVDGGITITANGCSNSAYLNGYAVPIKVLVQAYNTSRTQSYGYYIQWLQNFNTTAVVSASDLGCEYNNQYYVDVQLLSDSGAMCGDSTSMSTYVYTVRPSSTVSITSPASYSTINAATLDISVATVARSAKWSYAISGNDPGNYGTQPFPYGYVIGNTVTTYELQVSTDAYANSIVYTTSITSSYNPTTGSTAYLWTDSSGTVTGYSNYSWSSGGSAPYESSYCALGYKSGTSRVRTGSPSSTSNLLYTPGGSTINISVPASVLPSGTYYIRVRDKVTTTKTNGKVSTTTYDWSQTRGPVTFSSNAAKPWGGRFMVRSSVSGAQLSADSAAVYPAQYFEQVPPFNQDGYHSYLIDSISAVTDVVSKSIIYRSSGRWYFAFSPSDGFIGLAQQQAVWYTYRDYSSYYGKGAFWAIPPMYPTRTINPVLNMCISTGYYSDYKVNIPTMYRTQGSDYWWAVIDLDLGQIELYDPTARNCVYAFKIPYWTAGLPMCLCVPASGVNCYADDGRRPINTHYNNQKIGDRAIVYYDLNRTAPQSFATAQHANPL